MTTKSEDNVIVQGILIVFFLSFSIGLLWWIGDAIFGGDPCLKAKARLERTQKEERLAAEKADGISVPLTDAIRERMYAEYDAREACQSAR